MTRKSTGLTKAVAISAIAVVGGVLTMAASSGAQTSRAQLSLTLYKPDGSPMSNAAVRVYLLPFDPPARFTPALLAHGRANDDGVFRYPVDAARLPSKRTVGGFYNAQVWAVDPSHDWAAVQSLVVARDSDATRVVRAKFDVSRLAPSTDSQLVDVRSVTRQTSGSFAAASRSGSHQGSRADGSVLDTRKRWVKVLAWNVARGMRSTFTYSQGKATRTQVAASGAGSGWTISGWSLEETDRDASGSISKRGPYHKVRYARYRFNKYAACAKFCIVYWHIHHWTGGLDHHSDYDPPKFDRAHAEKLPSGGAVRSWGQDKIYGVSFSLAGLSLDSQSAYQSNTRVTWDKRPGCKKTRWLWGNGEDWPDAGIVQASCR